MSEQVRSISKNWKPKTTRTIQTHKPFKPFLYKKKRRVDFFFQMIWCNQSVGYQRVDITAKKSTRALRRKIYRRNETSAKAFIPTNAEVTEPVDAWRNKYASRGCPSRSNRIFYNSGKPFSIYQHKKGEVERGRMTQPVSASRAMRGVCKIIYCPKKYLKEGKQSQWSEFDYSVVRTMQK